MRRLNSKWIKLIHFLGDLSILFLVFYILETRYFLSNPGLIYHGVILLLLAGLITKAYTNPVFLNFYQIGRKLLFNSGIHLIFILGYLTSEGKLSDFNIIITGYLLALPVLFFWHSFYLKFIRFFDPSGKRRVIIVGNFDSVIPLFKSLTGALKKFYRVEGVFTNQFLDNNNLYQGLIIGRLDDLPHYISHNRVDAIFCTYPVSMIREIRELITIADNNLIRFRLIPEFKSFLDRRLTFDFFNKMPVMVNRNEPMEDLSNRIIKRLFDVIFSTCVILLIFPWLIPLIAIAIKSESVGPVFFVQKRNGRNNKEFACIKFRTMTVNNDSDKMQAFKGDKRVTKFGAFLRKTSLDELPQFLNVFLGHMSVIGPRPHMVKHTNEYAEVIDKFMVRHLVKPGISGWAQVNGYRGETREIKKMIKRIRYDAWYIENWSIWLDLRIIFLTIYNAVRGEKNAY